MKLHGIKTVVPGKGFNVFYFWFRYRTHCKNLIYENNRISLLLTDGCLHLIYRLVYRALFYYLNLTGSNIIRFLNLV